MKVIDAIRWPVSDNGTNWLSVGLSQLFLPLMLMASN